MANTSQLPNAIESIKLAYARFDTANPNIKQHAIVLTTNLEMYGLVSCPRDGDYVRVPNRDLEKFSNDVDTHNPFILIATGAEFGNLAKVLSETEECEVVPKELVNFVLSKLEVLTSS
ncbi:MAG: hypothetical protein AABW51_00355 [Nanoarchaeota archaeon]